MTETHDTTLEKIYPSGAEKWSCHTCGRQVIWQWPPLKLKSIVLVEGDSSASHRGEKSEADLAIVGLHGEADNIVFPSDLRDELTDILEDLDYN